VRLLIGIAMGALWIGYYSLAGRVARR